MGCAGSSDTGTQYDSVGHHGQSSVKRDTQRQPSSTQETQQSPQQPKQPSTQQQQQQPTQQQTQQQPTPPPPQYDQPPAYEVSNSLLTR